MLDARGGHRGESAPERVAGEPWSTPADVFSLAAITYELLTGRVPFEGEAPISIALKQINELPVPPGQLRPGLPPALEAVVLRALEKDPARRFADADEFIEALHAARAAPDVVPPPPVEVIEEEPDRSRWWLWLLALLALAAIAVGLYLLLKPDQVTVPNVVGRT